jgi:hypothetical protein
MTKNQNICLCCSNSMLRHLDRDRSYWFCRHCWQEIPDRTAQRKMQINLNPLLLNSSLSPQKQYEKIAFI